MSAQQQLQQQIARPAANPLAHRPATNNHRRVELARPIQRNPEAPIVVAAAAAVETW